MISRRRLGIAAALVLASTIAAAAESYPNRIVRLIVPFPAGGSNDVAARIIAPHLEQALGQTVIVDNRPAAGGIVGSDAVAKAPPDGHMLLLVASSYTVTPALNAKLPYDPERDFAPISLVNSNAMVFFVNPKLAVRTLPELVALARQRPGKLNYSSPGAGSQTHLVIELLSRR
jgi:tripartite-type tricarboxylate transporter receptor subunit TctC